MRVSGSVLLALLLMGKVVAAAQSDEESVETPLAPGQTIWSVAASAGFSTGVHASGFGSAMVRFDHIVSRPRGPGWLHGQLAYSVELIPLFLLSQSHTTYAAGFTLLGRHYFGEGRVRPFATIGIGMLVSEDEIPEDTAKLNFTPQAGFGVSFFRASGPSFSVEARFHHISNGGRVEPNPGINSAVIVFGVSF